MTLLRYSLLSAVMLFGLSHGTGLIRGQSPDNPAPQPSATAEANSKDIATPTTEPSPAYPPASEKSTADKPAAPPVKGPKKLQFNFRYQPWGDVLEWFAEQAGYSLVLDYPPQGTFNYRDDRDYSPAEAIDLLNSILLTKGYTLVLRDRMLMVVNLQDEIPPSFIARVTPDQLDKRGKYELLSTRFTLKNLSAEEANKEILELLGPQGRVVILPKARQLVVRETGGRLREIRDVLERADRARDPAEQEVRWFELSSVSPEEAVAMLRQIFEIKEDANATSDGSLCLATDPIGLRILASGTPTRLAQVEKILKTVDAPVGGEPVEDTPQAALQIEVYDVAPADPESVLKVTQTLLADLPGVRLATDPKTGNLIALARPKEHATIRATIDQIRRDAQAVEVIQLRVVDPQLAVLAIGKLFAADADKAPSVDADVANRQLLIRGSVGQIAQIRLLLEKMGETSGSASAMAGGKLRLVPVHGDRAKLLIDQLRELWPVLGQNELRIVPTLDADRNGSSRRRPTQQGPIDQRTPVPAAVPSDDSPKSEPQPATTERHPKPSRNVRVTFATAGAGQIADAKPATKKSEPKTSKPPILVLPAPDGLYLSSDDVGALDQLHRLIDSLQPDTASREPKLTVFYLRNSDAKTVAERLKEILASTTTTSTSSTSSSSRNRSNNETPPTGILGSLGTAGTLGHITPSGPISITPEPRLNALLVQAAPADVDMIDSILKILDRRDTPEEVPAQSKPRLIPVNNTSASEIAEVVKQVYANRLAGSSSNNNRGMSPPEMMMRMMRGRRGSSDRSSSNNNQDDLSKMTVSVDERTNSLIVAAPEALFEEVRELVNSLDNIASEERETVEVVTLKESNPDAVREALNSLLGDDVETTSGSSSRSSTSSNRSWWNRNTSGSSRNSSRRSGSSSNSSRNRRSTPTGGRRR